MTSMAEQARQRELPVWRSLLYVPANVPRFIEKAHTRGADAIMLDLEDSVPASEKAVAREAVAAAAAQVRRGGADVLVRVNRPLGLCVRDVEASVGADVDGIAITKVDGPSHVRLLDELVTELEADRGLAMGHTRFLVMIETPEAFEEMTDIARASPRVAAINIGGEDFALNGGFEPTDEALLMPKQRMILAARAAGVMPLGYIGTVADFSDWDRFRAMVRRSRQFGFDGASCVHPGQVAIVNEEYGPRPEDVAHAARVIEAAEQAQAEGRASFQLDGRMIDIPVIERARRLIARQRRIEARGARP
ncbi:CoA ester lyase [Pigmentiphaga sp. GD03639]|uniref:CoA ester lyase n=1 Tax=Pigmentiphaga daeguensis TaxID=414049 RepID=A0ABN1BEW4_9BURK|nr:MULTISPECIES: CoA ester lyase [unclassified Pigmentiphaga]MDH2238286.1 CoA ester lyase [Pigmentiphaga sp. GD03639]